MAISRLRGDGQLQSPSGQRASGPATLEQRNDGRIIWNLVQTDGNDFTQFGLGSSGSYSDQYDSLKILGSNGRQYIVRGILMTNHVIGSDGDAQVAASWDGLAGTAEWKAAVTDVPRSYVYRLTNLNFRGDRPLTMRRGRTRS